jgi:hypothetical protein
MEVKEYFAPLLISNIKVNSRLSETLFDIAGFPHYETVISNFYAFYFNPKASHGFGDLFLSSLTHLITLKRNGYKPIENYQICYIEKEVYTETGKFIDLVVKEPCDNDTEIASAIIIENKINARLYNDLQDYFNHIKTKKRKIGVVLSLRQEKNLPDDYVNITHAELISQIEKSSGSYFINASPRKLMILKEFINNLKSLSMTTVLPEHYEFYFKNQDRIKELIALNNQVIEDVIKKVNDTCEKLNMNLTLSAVYHSRLRYFVSTNSLIKFTVVIESLFNAKSEMGLYIELSKEGLEYLDVINDLEFTTEEKKYIYETSKVRTTYLLYAKSDLSLSQNDIINISDYLFNAISLTPLKSIFEKMEMAINLEIANNQLLEEKL